MKKLILALIITSSMICAFEKKEGSYNYNAVGVDVIAPAFTIGSRDWNKTTGIDINLSVASLVIANRLTLSLSFLKKFSDDTYIGIGGGGFAANIISEKNYVTGGVFPSLKFGKEYKDHFHEITIAVPQFTRRENSFLPCISYRYGF